MSCLEDLDSAATLLNVELGSAAQPSAEFTRTCLRTNGLDAAQAVRRGRRGATRRCTWWFLEVVGVVFQKGFQDSNRLSSTVRVFFRLGGEGAENGFSAAIFMLRKGRLRLDSFARAEACSCKRGCKR